MIRTVIIPAAIVIAGFGLAATLIATGPELEPRPTETLAPLVRVQTARFETVALNTKARGTVIPRTQSDLLAEVSGRVISVSSAMVPGGFFKRDEVLLKIDPLDYEVALERARAGVARATSELDNARKGYQRQLDLSEKQSTSASQRDDAQNRLRVAEASLREAKAVLTQSKRNLARTEVTAPYDGRVRRENIDAGQFVNRGALLASVYATDAVEVSLPIKDEELAYLDLPLSANEIPREALPTVVLRADFAGHRHSWTGKIVRSEGALDPQTRMINVVAEVKDPYAADNNKPPLVVGLFVEAEISGRKVPNIVRIPRAALRENDEVFLVTEGSVLEFQAVEVLRVVDDDVLIAGGINEGDQVCVSPFEAAVEGMRVRVAAQSSQEVGVR